MTASPPPLSDEAVERFTAALGEDAVLLSEEAIAEYRDPYWPAGDDTYAASATLTPSTTAEVQAIARIANELRVPLWTSSQGRNLGYGGASPRVRGSVQVNLRRMNRVLEINHELSYAVVEPGVSWFDLHAAIEAAGYDDLTVSIPDIGWGSVVGNSLDSGITYMPYGQDFQAPCGMEVVLADGTLLRTGMGAMEGNKAWHAYKRGLGPVLDPLFIQSNLGIVTRMGYWLYRKPEAYTPMLLTIGRDEDLEAAIDLIRELRLDGTLKGVPSMYNTLTIAGQLPGVIQDYQGEGVLPDEEIQRIADRFGIGRWAVRTALWGDGPVVEYQLAKIKQLWESLPSGAVLHDRTYKSDEYHEITEFLHKLQAGIPSLDVIESIPEGVGHISFSPVVPLTGASVREATSFMKDLMENRGRTNFIGGMLIINERACVLASAITYVMGDRDHTRLAFETAKALVEEGARRGYAEYRAHLDFMDLAQEQLSFNDHAYRRFCETIKDALDPNGILSPGRHGIWPATMRTMGG